MRSDIDRLLPLKPVAFHILMSLVDGERHGYAITQDIASRTASKIKLEPGNLYRSLKAMLDDGIIEESERRPAADLDDQRRRYYRITPAGRKAAKEESARLAKRPIASQRARVSESANPAGAAAGDGPMS